MAPSRECLAVGIIGYTAVIALGLVKRRMQRMDSSRILGSHLFEAAATFFGNNTTRFTTDLQLKLYALFKQVTLGDAPEDVRQGLCSFDPRRRAMDEAWISKRGLDQETAEREYIRIIESRCPKWRTGGCSDTTESEQQLTGWAVGSVPLDVIGDAGTKDESLIGQLCELVAEGNLNAVKEVIDQESAVVTIKDRDGMTCLHWASDRGHEEIVELLIEKRSNPNEPDHCGNTPLHIAAMSGQKEVVRLLLDAKADVGRVNQDGESAACIIKAEFPRLLLA
jgi:acyl-CoA-binding protein